MSRILEFPLRVPFLLLILTIGFCLVGNSASANPKYAAIVVDVKTGKTLFARNADAPRYPASLTKMMTLYVLFEELEAGRLSLDSKLEVSAFAAARPPSKLGLRPGSTIRVEDAIKALTVKSANDVAAVIADNVGGSQERFATRMTRTARAMGMKNTTFKNPHGLPDDAQKTTARDLAVLGRALQDRFPQYYDFFGTRTFKYGKATMRNHNHLLGKVEGVDGIKTGYIRASGFNLVTNVKRDGRHIVAVVMGGRTGASRDAHMRELIASYLPKASKGARSAPMLVAKSGYVPDAVALAPLPRSRPLVAAPADAQFAAVPVPGPAGPAEPINVAAIAPAPMPVAMPQPVAAVQSAPIPQSSDQIAARIAAANAAAELAYAPESGSNEDPIAKLTEMAQSRASGIPGAHPRPQPEADLIADGWHIQIGAVPSEDSAQDLLAKAQAKMGSVLSSVDPMTQVVEKDGVTLYRARFAGFTGKDEARAACGKLKAQSFACLALPN